MLDANQAHIALAIDGHEALDTPYRFDLELVGERPDLDLESLLNRPAWLTFGAAGQGVHGIVHRAAPGDSGQHLTRDHLSLVPRLAYLAQRSNQRIFQHLTVPQILARVLEEHGILDGDGLRFQLGADYPERDYCVQYAESDLHFVQRLCEEEGIHYAAIVSGLLALVRLAQLSWAWLASILGAGAITGALAAS